MERIGIIAGGGELPRLFASEARRKGFSPVAFAIKGEADPDLHSHTDTIYWIDLGKLQSLIDLFKKEGIKKAVLVGKVRKERFLSGVTIDERGLKLIQKLPARGDDAILRALSEELEKEGISLMAGHAFFDAMLAREGLYTKRKLTPEEKRDVAFGWKVAKEIGKLDIGQTVVVKALVVLAVEAIEGTDLTIKRACQHGGPAAVVVKVCKPQQDTRFDLPAVGLDTIEVMMEGGARVLALEAGKSMILSPDEVVKKADFYGISIIGIKDIDRI